jgi:3-O-alpha-D-mannopyranosyl-alpha-D-mannopyranose xylosylphosphotransferase
MRSVLNALPDKIKTFHLIVADFAFRVPEDLNLLPEQVIEKLRASGSQQVEQELEKEWRVAQTPTWLDFSKREGHPTLRYASHSEIFHLPTYDRDGQTMELGEHEWREQQWREKALPSFNSMSIESRVGWLHGLTDVTLSLNDDFFLLKPHAVSRLS